jgi:hypothetical protein
VRSIQPTLFAALLLVGGVAAHAGTASLSDGAQSQIAGVITDGFDGDASFFSVSGGHTYSSGSAGARLTRDGIYLLQGVSAQPEKGQVSADDAWFSVGAHESATINFAAAVGYVGFLWGSVDTYNTLQIFDGSTLLASYTGGTAGLDAFQVPDGRGSQGKSVHFNFSADEITSIVLTSSGPSFEIDNLSVSPVSLAGGPTPLPGDGGSALPVPEPQTWSLLVAGLAAVGLVSRRRRAR